MAGMARAAAAAYLSFVFSSWLKSFTDLGMNKSLEGKTF
jgi:hypothetical protein